MIVPTPDYNDPNFQAWLRQQQMNGRRPPVSRTSETIGLANSAYNLGDKGYQLYSGGPRNSSVANGADIMAIIASLANRRPVGAVAPGLNLYNRMNPENKIPYSGHIGDVAGLYGAYQTRNPFAAYSSGGNLVNRFNPGTVPGTDLAGGVGALYNIFRPGQDTSQRIMSGVQGAPQLLQAYNSLAGVGASGGAGVGGGAGGAVAGEAAAEGGTAAAGGGGAMAAWPLAVVALVSAYWDKQSGKKEEADFQRRSGQFQKDYDASGGNLPMALAPFRTSGQTQYNPIQAELQKIADQEYNRLMQQNPNAEGIDMSRYLDPEKMLDAFGQNVGGSENDPGHTEINKSRALQEAVRQSVLNQYLQAFKEGRVTNDPNNPMAGFQYQGYNHPSETATPMEAYLRAGDMPWQAGGGNNPFVTTGKRAGVDSQYAQPGAPGVPPLAAVPGAVGPYGIPTSGLAPQDQTGFQSLYGIANNPPIGQKRPPIYEQMDLSGA